MKVVLTGATGFVGGEVLRRLAARPEVEAITCLVRQAPQMVPPKARIVTHADFSAYPPALIDALADHAACIWALGSKAVDLGTPDVLERVTHTFTMAFAHAMAQRAAGEFTFCYLSGMGADITQTAWFPWERLTRHLKGRTERDLAVLQAKQPRFCAHRFRPGGILPATASAALDYLLAPIVVRVGVLADAMISAAVDPGLFRQASLVSNAGIKKLARETFRNS